VTRTFTANWNGVRVVFGAGTSGRLAEEIDRLGVRAALVVGSPGRLTQLQRIAAALGERCAGVWAKAREHVPLEAAEEARAQAARLGVDAVVSYGGGSSIGLGKAIALVRPVTLVAVPTTYSGSEMTPIHGITEGGRKRTGRDERVRPRLIVYDPTLTMDLPLGVTRSSLFNSMAHAVEALYAPGVDRETTDAAEQAITQIGRSLPVLAEDPGDPAVREDALYGAHLAGRALGVARMGLHHQLCHVLGATFGLPHAPTHAVVLPHVVRYNAGAAGEAIRRVAMALETPDSAASGVYDLAVRVGAPMSLGELGFRAADIEPAARVAMEAPYPNPRPAEQAALVELLSDAHQGRRPSTDDR
jgi:alcohol dehydrogenase class IV